MKRDKKGLPPHKICRNVGDYNRGTYENINRRAGFRLEDTPFTITSIRRETKRRLAWVEGQSTDRKRNCHHIVPVPLIYGINN